jgi:hypothetical protein
LFVVKEHDNILELWTFLEKNDLASKFAKSKQMFLKNHFITIRKNIVVQDFSEKL